MTCRFPRRGDSAFSPATAVVSVLRKPGSTKIFATTMLAAVAIAITITASGLWDDSPLATIFDNPAAPATVIPNVSDVWSTLDAVDSIMSSEWLIPPAFAATSAIAANQTVTEGDPVTIEFTVTDGDNDILYTWGHNHSSLNLGLPNNIDVPIVNFTAPQVDDDTTIRIRMIALSPDHPQLVSYTFLTIRDSDPDVYAGPDQTVAKGSTVPVTGATARDNEDNDADLTIAWTQDPLIFNITDADTLTPTIAVPSNIIDVNVTLTLSVTDTDLNSDTDTKVIIVRNSTVVDDATPPDITIAGDNPATVTVNTTYSDEGATCTDAVDGARTVTTDNQVNTGTVGTYSVIYSCSDTSNNEATATRTVNVRAAADTTPPDITIAGDNPATVTVNTTYSDEGATCTDAVDGARTVTTDNQVNTGTVGTYSVIYSCSDTSNNEATATRTVNVRAAADTTPPDITIAGDNPATVTVNTTYSDEGATCTDVVDGTRTVTTDNQVNTGTVGTYSVIYSCSDTSNNAATATRTVNVRAAADTTPPDITIAGDNPATVTVNTTYSDEGATCTDAVDGTRTVTTDNQVNTGTVGTYSVIYSCSDTSNNAATATRTVNVQAAVNIAPTVDAGVPLYVALGLSDTPKPIIYDPDGTLNHRHTWTQSPAGTVTFSNIHSLEPTISVDINATPGTIVTLTLTVNDNSGEHIISDTTTLTIVDPNNNLAPTVDVGDDINATERTSVTLTGIVGDPNKGDIPTLTYLWTHDLGSDTVVTGENTTSLRFTAPGISSPTLSFNFTLTVTDGGGETAIDDVTVTVHDVPLEVSYATYNPGNGQLKIIFNQNIESDPSYGSIHVRSTGSNSGDISLSDVTENSSPYPGRTITVILSTEQQETYGKLQNPQIDIDRGAVTDNDDVPIEETLNIAIITASNKKSSSSTAPIVDLRTLGQARIVDIPQSILEQVSSHDDSDPLKPIPHNDMFDLPLAINGYYYLLDDTTNTLIPQTVTVGQSTEIVFTVYTKTDLAHFTLYLNMQGNDVNYAGSDTYITYKNDGTVSVTDRHGYIADATITVTQEDDSMPEKKTVSITIHFDEPMGSTNVVAYMWNTDRKAAFVNLIDALEVVVAAEISENDDQDSTSTPSIIKSGIVIVGDDDDAQTLSLVRMWSGFESESLTDAELLGSLNFDYPGVDIPNWMMTELGALVSTGDVTVEEFRTALVYMLEMLTA